MLNSTDAVIVVLRIGIIEAIILLINFPDRKNTAYIKKNNENINTATPSKYVTIFTSETNIVNKIAAETKANLFAFLLNFLSRN